MHSDTLAIVTGGMLSVIIGQITTGESADLYNLLTNISATGESGTPNIRLHFVGLVIIFLTTNHMGRGWKES